MATSSDKNGLPTECNARNVLSSEGTFFCVSMTSRISKNKKNVIFLSPPPLFCFGNSKKNRTFVRYLSRNAICLFEKKKMNETVFTYSSPFASSNSRHTSTQTFEGWNSLSVSRTTSFQTIQNEVYQSVIITNDQYSSQENEAVAGPRRNSSRPGVPTTGNGETPPATGELIPIGDMLLPMIVMAMIYLVVKLMRKHKTSQAL